jgi:hypothetical protein
MTVNRLPPPKGCHLKKTWNLLTGFPECNTVGTFHISPFFVSWPHCLFRGGAARALKFTSRITTALVVVIAFRLLNRFSCSSFLHGPVVLLVESSGLNSEHRQQQPIFKVHVLLFCCPSGKGNIHCSVFFFSFPHQQWFPKSNDGKLFLSTF